jgi:hypothetical protein
MNSRINAKNSFCEQLYQFMAVDHGLIMERFGVCYWCSLSFIHVVDWRLETEVKMTPPRHQRREKREYA